MKAIAKGSAASAPVTLLKAAKAFTACARLQALQGLKGYPQKHQRTRPPRVACRQPMKMTNVATK